MSWFTQGIAYDAHVPWEFQPRGETEDARRRRKKEFENAKHEARFAPPIAELRAEIAGGLWHRKFRADRIAAKHKVKVQRLLDRAGVAVSETGAWICIPGDNTPDDAPDEGGQEVAADAS